MNNDDLRAFLEKTTEADRTALLALMREQCGLVIHPLEKKWNTTAEDVLEAIDQANDFTQRGVRGILAEATFKSGIIPKWAPDWAALPVAGDAYDARVADEVGEIRIQVKLQRRERGVPKIYTRRGFKRRDDVYMVETDRTRNGTKKGSKTRPYRVDEFDVLAVCLQPLTQQWTDFLYCAVKDLRRQEDESLLATKQPIYIDGTNGWTNDFHAAARRVRQQSA